MLGSCQVSNSKIYTHVFAQRALCAYPFQLCAFRMNGQYTIRNKTSSSSSLPKESLDNYLVGYLSIVSLK